jgi:hypothetical protein
LLVVVNASANTEILKEHVLKISTCCLLTLFMVRFINGSEFRLVHRVTCNWRQTRCPCIHVMCYAINVQYAWFPLQLHAACKLFWGETPTREACTYCGAKPHCSLNLGNRKTWKIAGCIANSRRPYSSSDTNTMVPLPGIKPWSIRWPVAFIKYIDYSLKYYRYKISKSKF